MEKKSQPQNEAEAFERWIEHANKCGPCGRVLDALVLDMVFGELLGDVSPVPGLVIISLGTVPAQGSTEL